VTPDLMTIAKPLAGGLPMGAVLMTEKVAAALQPGDHGTTFGGGPLVASAALATCGRIASPGFLESVRQKGHTLANRLGGVWMRHPEIKAVRGTGMIWGIELEGSAAEVVARALEAGLLICSAGPNVVRLLPPLIASDEELTRGVDILDEVL
jgi:acetylornithine/succinyldiaminopimelate/putrescine aminotransferase